MGVEIGMSGLGELRDELERMVSNADEVETEALQEAAEPIQKDAMATTAFHDRNADPEKRLRNNIKISKVTKKRAGYRVIRVYCAKREASLVEYGHSGKYADPHPFLAPAFERHKEEAAQTLFDRMKEALMSK